jgi:hypothetical protein
LEIEIMEFTKPQAKSSHNSDYIEKLRKIVSDRSLCGLANNTKWDRLITFMRNKEGWTPSYRFKCIDGFVSYWDTEWWYHLPFPFISVEWFDIGYVEERHIGRLVKPDIIDHSSWIEDLLSKIRFEYEKGIDFYRIFGYSPKNYELFESLDTEQKH